MLQQPPRYESIRSTPPEQAPFAVLPLLPNFPLFFSVAFGSRIGEGGQQMHDLVTLLDVLVSYVHTSAAGVVREGE